MTTCYTIGHSNYRSETFVAMLVLQGVDVIIDVRSIPYCGYATWFNRERLQHCLEVNDISYIWMGDCLGGKAGSDGFDEALERVVSACRVSRVALMCGEKDPLECHRFSLLTYALADKGVEANHLLEGGGSCTTREVEERLLVSLDSDYRQLNLFAPQLGRKEAVRDALQQRAWAG